MMSNSTSINVMTSRSSWELSYRFVAVLGRFHDWSDIDTRLSQHLHDWSDIQKPSRVLWISAMLRSSTATSRLIIQRSSASSGIHQHLPISQMNLGLLSVLPICQIPEVLKHLLIHQTSLISESSWFWHGAPESLLQFIKDSEIFEHRLLDSSDIGAQVTSQLVVLRFSSVFYHLSYVEVSWAPSSWFVAESGVLECLHQMFIGSQAPSNWSDVLGALKSSDFPGLSGVFLIWTCGDSRMSFTIYWRFWNFRGSSSQLNLEVLECLFWFTGHLQACHCLLTRQMLRGPQTSSYWSDVLWALGQLTDTSGIQSSWLVERLKQRRRTLWVVSTLGPSTGKWQTGQKVSLVFTDTWHFVIARLANSNLLS